MGKLTLKEAKDLAWNFFSLEDEHSIGIAIGNNRSVYNSTLKTLGEYRKRDPVADKLYRALNSFR